MSATTVEESMPAERKAPTGTSAWSRERDGVSEELVELVRHLRGTIAEGVRGSLRGYLEGRPVRHRKGETPLVGVLSD